MGRSGNTIFMRAFEVGLFLGSVKIVGHEKSAAKQIIAQFFRLLLGEAPLPHLHGVEPGPVVDLIAIVQIHALLHGPRLNAGQPANRLRKCRSARG